MENMMKKLVIFLLSLFLLVGCASLNAQTFIPLQEYKVEIQVHNIDGFWTVNPDVPEIGTMTINKNDPLYPNYVTFKSEHFDFGWYSDLGKFIISDVLPLLQEGRTIWLKYGQNNYGFLVRLIKE
jgi:uncharacterized protein YcfL